MCQLKPTDFRGAMMGQVLQQRGFSLPEDLSPASGSLASSLREYKWLKQILGPKSNFNLLVTSWLPGALHRTYLEFTLSYALSFIG